MQHNTGKQRVFAFLSIIFSPLKIMKVILINRYGTYFMIDIITLGKPM